jgi:hypothetical protein
MSFRLIEAEKAEHRVSRLCSVLGVTRAGFYAWRRRPPSARSKRDLELEALIRYQGVHVGKKRIARLMREAGPSGRLPAWDASPPNPDQRTGSSTGSRPRSPPLHGHASR